MRRLCAVRARGTCWLVCALHLVMRRRLALVRGGAVLSGRAHRLAIPMSLMLEMRSLSTQTRQISVPIDISRSWMSLRAVGQARSTQRVVSPPCDQCIQSLDVTGNS